MKKRYKALIFFASLGILTSLVGAALMKFDLSQLTSDREFITRNYESEEIDSTVDTLSFSISSSKVTIYDSPTNMIEIEYFSDEDFLKFDSSTNVSFRPSLNINYWYNPFSLFKNNYEIKIGLPTNAMFSNFELIFEACSVEYSCATPIDNLKMRAEASSINMKSTSINNLLIDADASSVEIEGHQFKEIEIVANTASIELNNITIDNLLFDLNTSSLDASIKGEKADYQIKILKELSSCNLENTGEGSFSKAIEGKLEVSAANIKFVI